MPFVMSCAADRSVKLCAMALVDDLVRAVQDTAAVPHERAAATVRALVRLLGARLPSPLYGELQAHLNRPQGADASGPPVLP
jgi:hypothetical protein